MVIFSLEENESTCFQANHEQISVGVTLVTPQVQCGVLSNESHLQLLVCRDSEAILLSNIQSTLSFNMCCPDNCRKNMFMLYVHYLPASYFAAC